jgi:hypothetical protein
MKEAGMARALRRLVNLLKRDRPDVAAKKIFRYLQWQGLSQIRRWRIMRMPDAETRFTRIYEVNFWAAKESVSGPGSSLNDTQELRRRLPELFRQFSIATVFDAPCGDFNWMKAVVAAEPIRYVGADIVKPMVDKNIERYRDERVDFRSLDITRDGFPKADLWFCRDCFYHLSIADIQSALLRFLESDIPYLLASTHKAPPGPSNYDITTGDFRFTDLLAAPFSLPHDVLFRINDNASSDMCLWSREQVSQSAIVCSAIVPAGGA